MRFAVQNDLEDWELVHYANNYAVLKALHDKGGIAEGDAEKFRPLLQGYAQTLARLPDLPVNYFERPNLLSVEYETQGFLKAHGMSAAACATYAQCLFRENHNEAAIHYYRIALLWQPQNEAIKQGLAQVEEVERFAKDIGIQFPKIPGILCARPVPDEKGNKRWAVIEDGSRGRNGLIRDARAAIYAEKNGKYIRLCHDSSFECDVAVLHIARVTERPQPEIIVDLLFRAADSPVYAIQIYEVNRRSLRSLLSAYSGAPLAMVDLQHNGRYQARTGHTMSPMVAHGDMPHPPHYYAYNGDKYVLADRDYPEAYNDFLARAQNALKDHPDDFCLFYGIGYAYDIQKSKARANGYYHRAEIACRNVIKKEGGAKAPDYLRHNLKQILARVPFPDF